MFSNIKNLPELRDLPSRIHRKFSENPKDPIVMKEIWDIYQEELTNNILWEHLACPKRIPVLDINNNFLSSPVLCVRAIWIHFYHAFFNKVFPTFHQQDAALEPNIPDLSKVSATEKKEKEDQYYVQFSLSQLKDPKAKEVFSELQQLTLQLQLQASNQIDTDGVIAKFRDGNDTDYVLRIKFLLMAHYVEKKYFHWVAVSFDYINFLNTKNFLDPIKNFKLIIMRAFNSIKDESAISDESLFKFILFTYNILRKHYIEYINSTIKVKIVQLLHTPFEYYENAKKFFQSNRNSDYGTSYAEIVGDKNYERIKKALEDWANRSVNEDEDEEKNIDNPEKIKIEPGSSHIDSYQHKAPQHETNLKTILIYSGLFLLLLISFGLCTFGLGFLGLLPIVAAALHLSVTTVSLGAILLGVVSTACATFLSLAKAFNVTWEKIVTFCFGNQNQTLSPRTSNDQSNTSSPWYSLILCCLGGRGKTTTVAIETKENTRSPVPPTSEAKQKEENTSLLQPSTNNNNYNNNNYNPSP